jgi:branched-chain amino acid transport system ATP-binding protein
MTESMPQNTTETSALLAVEELQAWYGESHILHGVTFEVRPGEVVTLLGRNGVGKTTTLKSVMGMVERRAGSVRLHGRELIRLSSDAIARAGIAICPEERGIFASLDVRENLLLPPQLRPGGLDLARIFELFPNLRERLSSQGTKLSGGEQQMLAIARALLSRPRLLLLDEPSLGLAPKMSDFVFSTIADLRKGGLTVLLVEQKARQALKFANRAYLLETGRVIASGSAADLAADSLISEAFLGKAPASAGRSSFHDR